MTDGWDLVRRADLVRLALEQGHTVTRCPHCVGPLVRSQTRPFSQCLKCWHVQKALTTQPAARRWRCDACRRYFVARLGRATCPACRDGAIRRQKRQQNRGRISTRTPKPGHDRTPLHKPSTSEAA